MSKSKCKLNLLLFHRPRPFLKGLPGAQTKDVEHLEVFIEGGVRGGQEFVAGEDGIGSCQEAEGLLAEAHFSAAGGKADNGPGHDDAGSGHHSDHILNRYARLDRKSTRLNSSH